MPKVQYYCAATLDGYIADPDDGIEWLTDYEGSFLGAPEGTPPSPMGEGASYEPFYERVGALVSGSATYEFVLDHVGPDGDWPYPGKPWWVLTSRGLAAPPNEGADVRLTRASIADLHAEITGVAGDRNLWVLGGGGVASDFADAGLLDELLLTVVPVVLGAGKPLFERPPGPLSLTGTQAYGNGMVELHYDLRASRQVR